MPRSAAAASTTSASRAAAAAAAGMTSVSNSMLYSLLLFVIVLSAQQMNKATLASSELYTLLGGFVSSLLFLLALTLIANIQESMGSRTGWGAVALAELIACVAAGAVHRVCVTTCIICSIPLLYEVNKVSTLADSSSSPAVAGNKKK